MDQRRPGGSALPALGGRVRLRPGRGVSKPPAAAPPSDGGCSTACRCWGGKGCQCPAKQISRCVQATAAAGRQLRQMPPGAAPGRPLHSCLHPGTCSAWRSPSCIMGTSAAPSLIGWGGEEGLLRERRRRRR